MRSRWLRFLFCEFQCDLESLLRSDVLRCFFEG